MAESRQTDRVEGAYTPSLVVIGKLLTWPRLFSHHSHHLMKSMVGTEISDEGSSQSTVVVHQNLSHTTNFVNMSFQGQQAKPLATAAAAPPSLLTQVGMAGTAAVITVSFIHPMDVVKVC